MLVRQDEEEFETRRAIILVLFVYNLIGFIMTNLTVFAGLLNLLGLSIVFAYLLFTTGFGYFFVKLLKDK